MKKKTFVFKLHKIALYLSLIVTQFTLAMQPGQYYLSAYDFALRHFNQEHKDFFELNNPKHELMQKILQSILQLDPNLSKILDHCNIKSEEQHSHLEEYNTLSFSYQHPFAHELIGKLSKETLEKIAKDGQIEADSLNGKDQRYLRRLRIEYLISYNPNLKLYKTHHEFILNDFKAALLISEEERAQISKVDERFISTFEKLLMGCPQMEDKTYNILSPMCTNKDLSLLRELGFVDAQLTTRSREFYSATGSTIEVSFKLKNGTYYDMIALKKALLETEEFASFITPDLTENPGDVLLSIGGPRYTFELVHSKEQVYDFFRDDSPNLDLKDQSWVFFIVSKGWGDCPSGCMHRHSWLLGAPVADPTNAKVILEEGDTV